MRIHVLNYIPCSNIFIDNSFNSPCNICICMVHIYNIYILYIVHIWPQNGITNNQQQKVWPCPHDQGNTALFFWPRPWPVSKRSGEPTGTLAPIRPRDELSKRRVSTTTAEMEVSHQGPAEVPPWETGKLGFHSPCFSQKRGSPRILFNSGNIWEWWF